MLNVSTIISEIRHFVIVKPRFHFGQFLLVLRGDRLDDFTLGFHGPNAFYSNPYEVEFFKNDVDNVNGQFGKINAAQRADYLVQPTGISCERVRMKVCVYYSILLSRSHLH